MRPSRLLPVLLVALVASAGCSQEPQLRAAPVDDGARPVGSGGPRLSDGYDRDLDQLATALPTDPLRGLYSEVQELPTETLRVSETNVCRSGDGEPALPATEVYGTRRPAPGHDQPESADVVAARAQTEFQAGQFTDDALRQMRDCAEHARDGRDLGEGSYAPAERATTRTEEFTVEGWAGARHAARVQITSNTWQDEITREWVVVRQGQIVVSVRVEGSDADAVRTEADALITSVTDVLDGRAETPALPGLVTASESPADTATGSLTGTGSGSPTDISTGTPTARPTGSVAQPTTRPTGPGDAATSRD